MSIFDQLLEAIFYIYVIIIMIDQIMCVEAPLRKFSFIFIIFRDTQALNLRSRLAHLICQLKWIDLLWQSLEKRPIWKECFLVIIRAYFPSCRSSKFRMKVSTYLLNHVHIYTDLSYKHVHLLASHFSN